MSNGDLRPGIYSDCTMDTSGTSPEYHVFMGVTGGSLVATSLYATGYAPPPIGIEELGRIEYSVLYVVDMGVSYSGDCDEVTGSLGSVPAVSGHVYCGIVGNTLGEKVLLRGTYNGSTFTNYQVLTDAVVVGTPVAPAAPVPALPLGALWIIGGLAGLLGMRQLRKAA